MSAITDIIGALKAIWSSNVPKLAEGGIAKGETLALVGEYAGVSANPEVIAPLSDLTALIQAAIRDVGGTIPNYNIEIPSVPSVSSPMIQNASRGVSIPDEITITGRLAGNDIMLSNERAGRRKMLVE